MANFFKTDLGVTENLSLSLEAINLGDSYLYFKINGTENYILQPSTKVKVMIAPNNNTFTSGELVSFLKQPNPMYNNNLGCYYVEGGENNTLSKDNLSFNYIKIENRNFENTKFNLYWLITRNTDELFGQNTIGVYSFPHNIESKEIVLSGNQISNNLMQYNILWSSIQNEGSIDYSNGPYSFYVSHRYGLNRNGIQEPVSGFSSTLYYPSGTMISGINISLPFYDERKINQQIPALYNFQLNNIGASGLSAKTYNILIDHDKLINSNKYFKNLDTYTFSSVSKENLKKVDEIKIDSNIINRKRLSIGINDISINENTYLKQGIYISKPYNLDFNIYTFSLKVIETIPNYLNIDPYDIIKYYVEFNSNKWEPISPLNRNNEQINEQLIPKMFVFDKNDKVDINSTVKYLIYNSNINSFRIKIVFDLTKITDKNFIPPEVKDYKCIIYDKSKFFNL